MVKITYTYDLWNYQIAQAPANSLTYVTITQNSVGEGVFLYESSKFVSPTVYLEFYGKSATTTTNDSYVALFDIGANEYASAAAGSQVASSEVITTSSTNAWYRSSAITLTDGNRYTAKVKNEATAVTTGIVYVVRIVIIDDVGTAPSKIFNYFPLAGASANTSVAAGANVEITTGARFTYNSSEDDGTVNFYVEIEGSPNTNSGTMSFYLYNVTDSSTVTDSTTSVPYRAGATYKGRVRSSALTLEDGKTYAIYVTAATVTGYYGRCLLIKEQTGTISKTSIRAYTGFRGGTATSTSYAAASTSYSGFKYVSADWTSPTISYEEWMKMSSSSYTAYGAIMSSYGGTTALANTELTTTSTSMVKLTSASAPTLTDGVYYNSRGKSSSASGTGTFYGSYLVFSLTFTVDTLYYPSTMAIGYWGA